jgi:hypothetical protein
MEPFKFKPIWADNRSSDFLDFGYFIRRIQRIREYVVIISTTSAGWYVYIWVLKNALSWLDLNKVPIGKKIFNF